MILEFTLKCKTYFTWSKFNGDPEVGIGSAESQTGLLVFLDNLHCILIYCSNIPFGIN
jgi:hypothetical protein